MVMAALKARVSAHNLVGVARFFKFFATFLFIPFTCNARNGQLQARSKYFRVFWVILGPFLTALHSVSAIFTLLKSIAQFSSCPSAWNNVNALVGLALASILLQTNASITAHGISMARNYDEVLHFCNQIFRYRGVLKGLGATLPKDVAVLKPLVIIFCVRIYSNTALCLSQPEKPLFLYWVIPSQWKTATVHNVYAFINAFYACTYWATLMFTIIVFFMFVETATACLQFRCRKPEGSFYELKSSYRELLVASRIFENAFGRLALPAYMTSGIALTFASYGVVRFFGKVGFKLYFSFISPFLGIHWGFANLLRPAARMQSLSRELRTKMATLAHLEGSGRYERSLLRSLPDLGLKVGNFFTVARETHANVLGFVAVNAMTLLITL